MIGGVSKWAVDEAWEAAGNVVASAYRVDVALLRAESRGRGPKPLEELREPRKIAVYLTVLLSDCSGAELAARLRLHKDTINSHAAEIRKRLLVDGDLETRIDALALLATERLRGAPERMAPAPEQLTLQAVVSAIHARFDRLESLLSRAAAIPSPTDGAAFHPSTPDNHETVIKISSARSRR